MTGVWTPQWLYEHITLDAGETLRLKTGAFVNNQAWPLHLKWLSLLGPVAVDAAGEFSENEGGVARRLQFKLSVTQKGDISNLFANAQAIFTDHQVGFPGKQSRYDFSPPFPLGPEEGIVVKQSSFIYRPPPNNRRSVMFTGRRFDKNLKKFLPSHLGAVDTEDLVSVEYDTVFDSIDLYNNGEEPFWIQQMLLDCGSNFINGGKLETAWRINPTAGIPWMPNPAPIPVGNLAPLSLYELDIRDAFGPNVYVFPPHTMLRPRQRFGIEVKNLSNSQQQFGLCLHGMMEVK